MVGSDHSMTNSFLLIITLVMTSIALSLLKPRFPFLERWLEGIPFMIVENGKLLEDRMRKSRVDLGDILAAARKQHGLERLGQIKYAIVEAGGEISIVPMEK